MIDGNSRLVVYLRSTNNNRAETVYDLFLKAIVEYGLPSRVRCDQGLENTQVARHMLHHRGETRRSVLVGSSVHNLRIQRLWRDSHRCVTSVYYHLFYFLEENNFLDPINDQHLFALHFVFLPRINRALEYFRMAWNEHGLRTEGNQTPRQLFAAGALRLRHSDSVALDFFDMIPESYGVDEGSVTVQESGGVEIPPLRINITDEQMAELNSRVLPLRESNNFGIDLYVRALEFIESLSSLCFFLEYI